MFDDLDKVGIVVLYLHGSQTLSKSLLEVYEDMLEVLLVLEMFLMTDS